MVATASGRRGKVPKGLKGGTTSTKSHRFESFSQRVARLKIDPVHRVRRNSFSEENGDETSSHFRASLEHWMELNLTENFTEFSQRASRFCENLPQIIHHQDAIMDLLVEYISKKDELCMEPLLSLVSQFARDLGPRFEKHFASAVQLVASVAATHANIEVIEWSFTCLAWIFKFLSRLLVPDLRQLLEVMAPYLGKQRQKYFVTRFAAESLSFLLRKAAVVYYKDKAPLERAVGFLFRDLSNTSDTRVAGTYQNGLMVLFSEAIKGPNGGIHSTGPDIFRCIIDTAATDNQIQNPLVEGVVDGILINLVHHSSANTFMPVLDVVCEYIESLQAQPSAAHFQCRLILLCLATRKGSRVACWKRVHKSLLTLLQRATESTSFGRPGSVDLLLGGVCLAIQMSPMDELLPYMRPIMETITDRQLSHYFLPFCSLFSVFESDRFQSVVLTYFQRFITTWWKDYEDGLCVLLPKLERSASVTSDSNKSGFLTCPTGWKDQIVRRFRLDEPMDKDVVLMNAYLNVQHAMSFSSEPSVLPQILEALHRHSQLCLQDDSKSNEALANFSRGQGLLSYVRLAKQSNTLDLGLWQRICTQGSAFANIPIFLEATLAYVSACPELPEYVGSDLESFATSLLANLSGPSHPLRLLSLKVLQKLLARSGAEHDSVSLAIEIESSELTLQSSRMLSMEIRKLASCYADVSSQKWHDRLIPSFCFGLLSKKLASVWEDSCNALKAVGQHKNGEDVISDLAVRWLQDPSPTSKDKTLPEEDTSQAHVSSEFGCFNVVNVNRAVSSCFSEAQDPGAILSREFQTTHEASSNAPVHARSQAIRVLNAVPHIAEKKSRQLVPLFLDWAARDDDISGPGQQAHTMSTGEEGKVRWNLRDKKDMLSLFGRFSNPKVLYKSAEVHDALTGLLCNGEPEIQKLALKAILAWKSPFIVPYEENLMNIIDDSRFRDELSVFVHVGKDNSVIKEDHRRDLLPYVLRLLYGKVVARGGSKGTLGTQEMRRKAILRTISDLPEEDFSHFIEISYGSLSEIQVLKDDDGGLSHELLSLRKQYGLLRMIESMFSVLKNKMTPYSESSLNVVLYCLTRACRQLKKGDDASTESGQNFQVTFARNIRTLGIRCLDLIFSVAPGFDWTPYMPLIFRDVISPRLGNFAVETAQGISGLLQLFRTWAAHPRSCLYFVHDSVIPRVIDCLGVESAREEVKRFVIDEILSGLVKSATGGKPDKDGDVDLELSELVRSKVLAPHVETMLAQLESLLRTQPPRTLMVSAVDILSKLAAFVESSGETSRLISTTTYLLEQGPDRVPPKTKGGLLRVLQHFLPLYHSQEDSDLSQRVFEVLSSLFDYFKDDANRETLSSVFVSLSNIDAELKDVAGLCADLNSLSPKRLDEADFERRLAAFDVINEQRYETFNAKQWRPLIFNLLYHMKDVEELAVRASASLGLKRFISSAETKVQAGASGFDELLNKILLPALRSGVKQFAETVRAEFVGVLGYLIQQHRYLLPVQDMYDLLANGDEEASFFNNILHIQQHRRLRALRRLSTEATKGKLKSLNISSLFFPLIEHYVFNKAEDEHAHNLTAETVFTLGALSQGLEWNQFKAIFRRYKGYMNSKPGLEKNVLRLLGQMTDALSGAMKEENSPVSVAGEQAMEDIKNETSTSSLKASLPSKGVVQSELKEKFIPFFTEFVHRKEESEVSLRLPASITTCKLLKLLPEDEMALLLPSVLLDVANVLRSRSQDSRDVARKTLSDIALILGPSYFGYILRELRTTLARGYQLHVRSFTVHSILVSTADHFQPGDLDPCLEDLAAVVMDDIFGTVGQEKDAEEYVSKMKEVKSSKSYDSMELLAKNASVQHLSSLVRPLQRLLLEKLTSSLVKKVDELLRRLGVGILRNPGAESRDILVFCYEVVKESHNTEPLEPRDAARRSNNRFLVNLVGRKKSGTGRSTSSYQYKLARFSIDVLRSVLNKYNSLQTPQNLQGFLPIIGDALIQGYEEVKLSAIRLLATIIKLPLADLDKNSDVYVAEAIKLIRETPNTNTEAAQASIKFIASILRERRSTKIKDSYLAYLLKRISNDIEEPDRQGVTFNFIRAVMTRKFVVPEMYELADNIATMMVTSQARNSRDLARGVYVHFLIEYPQVKSRWSKQLGFMAKNLDYRHKEGRQSVMEAIHLLLSKTGADLAQDIVGTFFVPVIMAMSNDEFAECREMASALLGNIFGRADGENIKSILTLVKTWMEQEENPLLTIAGLQAMKIFFDADVTNRANEVRFVRQRLPRLLTRQDDSAWQVPFQALQLFSKITNLFPALTLNPECKDIWSLIQACQFHSHPSIKLSTANLLGTWFADVAKANAANGLGSVPLSGTSGLELDGDTILTVTQASMRCLKSPGISEELATQIVRNVIFLGRCLGQNRLVFGPRKTKVPGTDEISDEDEEDDCEETSDKTERTTPGVSYIFHQASAILRREPLTTRAGSLTGKTACMKLIISLCNHVEVDQVKPSLQTLLFPLLHLTDPSIPPPRSSDEGFETAYKALVQSSHEILDLLQKKMGTTEFVTPVSQARSAVKERREERRAKRRIEAVANPERFELGKRRKQDRKREKRKEKGQEFRGKRQGW